MTLVFPKTPILPFTDTYFCKSCLNCLKALPTWTLWTSPCHVTDEDLAQCPLRDAPMFLCPLVPAPPLCWFLLSLSWLFLFLPLANKWTNCYRLYTQPSYLLSGILLFIPMASISWLPDLHHQLPGFKCSGSIHIRYSWGKTKTWF